MRKITNQLSSQPKFVDLKREAAIAEGAPLRAILDWLYIASLQNDTGAVFSIAKQLAQSGDLEEKRFFLQSLEHANSLNCKIESTIRIPQPPEHRSAMPI